MAKVNIPLGRADRLATVFSYPNRPGDPEPLAATILHWLGQTLVRDGLKASMAEVDVEGGDYVLQLDGPSEGENRAYAQRIPELVRIGSEVASGPVQQLKSRQVWCTDGKLRPLWDPNATGLWRFFLTLGVGLVNHRTLQFFHYPPARLLDPLRDSMQDPVTLRCKDLLIANGVKPDETKHYETRVNSTPIAAPDDQGTAPKDPAADPMVGGLIPIGYFRKFEGEMIRNLLTPHATAKGHTIPMTAYGSEPRQQLGGLSLRPDKAVVVELLPGLKTAVLGSNHPYRFYAEAQGGSTVGSGTMLPGKDAICTELQQDDLAVVRWQVQMAKDPSQDPWRVIREAQDFWKAKAQQDRVAALVRRHGSLQYDDPAGFRFRFLLRLDGTPEA